MGQLLAAVDARELAGATTPDAPGGEGGGHSEGGDGFWRSSGSQVVVLVEWGDWLHNRRVVHTIAAAHASSSPPPPAPPSAASGSSDLSASAVEEDEVFGGGGGVTPGERCGRDVWRSRPISADMLYLLLTCFC